MAAMAYCGPLGLAYTTFLEWDELSRSAALAWRRREDQRCGGCGQVRDDWMARDGDGQPVCDEHGNQMEADPPPLAVVDHYCPACDALGRARKAREKQLAEQPGVHLAFGPDTG